MNTYRRRAERSALADLRQENERLREELETLKRLYDNRGKAMLRPCLNCGHKPLIIKPADQKGA